MTATPPPQRIADRYTVRGVIGEGGMGSVYHGVDDVTGQAVAIKRLKPEILAADPGMLARFEREAEALRRLNHPNIVQVLATETEDDAHYIIMEYVGGGSLRDVLDESAPDVTRTLQIALELADALTRAHHLRIIHRDIKPANVLLAEDGTPRLTDFGVAYMEARERMTQTGMAVGTLDYLSPEGLDGAPAEARADIWAFGVMLFEMLAGERPFTGAGPAQVVTAILTQPVPDLKLFNPEAPDTLVDLINRMLAKDPAERIASTRQVGAELEAILRGDSTPLPSRFQTPTPSEVKLPDTATTVGTPTPASATVLPAAVTEVSGRRMSPRGWLILIGGLAAAAIIVALIVLFDSGVFDGEDDTPEAAAATEVVEATPEVTAVVRDDGWVQLAGEFASVYVPPEWLDMQEAGLVDTAMEMMRQIDVGAEFLDLYGDVFLGNMEVFAGNIITFDGIVISWENFGVAIPDGMVEPRVRELVGTVPEMDVLEFDRVTLPFGSQPGVRVLARYQAEDQSLWQLGYFVPVGTRFYTIFFYGLSDDFPNQIPLFDAVLETIEIRVPGAAVAEATPEATAEFAATPAPTAVIREDGWQVLTGGRVTVAVPPDWVDMQAAGMTDTMFDMLNQVEPAAQYFETFGPDYTENVDIAAGNVVNLAGLVVIWEEVGIEISQEWIELRANRVFESFDVEIVERDSVTVPFGYGIRWVTRWDDPDGETFWQLGYYVAVGTRLYTIGFYGTGDDFPDEIPAYEEVMATMNITTSDSAPEVTPEATEEVVATPAPTAVIREGGWQVLTGGRVTVAVPPDWLDLEAAGMTETMIDMVSQIDAAAQFIETYGDAYFENIGIAAGNTVRLTGLVVTWEEVGVVMADSMVQLRAQQLIESLATSAVMEELEPVTLPFGTGSRWLVQAGQAEGQTFWQYGFYIRVGTRIYTIGFFGTGEDFRDQIPLFDEVMETMTIAETDEPAEATAESAP